MNSLTDLAELQLGNAEQRDVESAQSNVDAQRGVDVARVVRRIDSLGGNGGALPLVAPVTVNDDPANPQIERHGDVQVEGLQVHLERRQQQQESHVESAEGGDDADKDDIVGGPVRESLLRSRERGHSISKYI